MAEAEIALGGVAPRTILAPITMETITGQPWNEETLQKGIASLAQDVYINSQSPGLCLNAVQHILPCLGERSLMIMFLVGSKLHPTSCAHSWVAAWYLPPFACICTVHPFCKLRVQRVSRLDAQT